LDTGPVELLVCGDARGHVSAYEVSSKERLADQRVHTQSLRRLLHLRGTTSGNTSVLTASMDGSMALLDTARELAVQRTFVGHTRGVCHIAHSATHRVVVSSALDAKLLLWDTFVPRTIGTLQGTPPVMPVAVATHDTSHQISAAYADGKVRVWDLRTWKLLQTSECNPGDEHLTAACYDRKRSRFLTAGGRIRAWTIERPVRAVRIREDFAHKTGCSDAKRRKQRTVVSHTALVATLFSKQFATVLTVTADERVTLWNLWTGRRTFEFRTTHGAALTTACLDANGRRLLTCDVRGCRNKRKGATQKTLPSISLVMHVPHSFNSVLLASRGTSAHFLRLPDPAAELSARQKQDDRNTLLCQDEKSPFPVRAVLSKQSFLLTAHGELRSAEVDEAGVLLSWSCESGKLERRLFLPACPLSLGFLRIASDEASVIIVALSSGHAALVHAAQLRLLALTSLPVFQDAHILECAEDTDAQGEYRARLAVSNGGTQLTFFDVTQLRVVVRNLMQNEISKKRVREIDSIGDRVNEMEPFCLASDESSDDAIEVDSASAVQDITWAKSANCFIVTSSRSEVCAVSVGGTVLCQFGQAPSSWPLRMYRRDQGSEEEEDSNPRPFWFTKEQAKRDAQGLERNESEILQTEMRLRQRDERRLLNQTIPYSERKPPYAATVQRALMQSNRMIVVASSGEFTVVPLIAKARQKLTKNCLTMKCPQSTDCNGN
ncbi:MAG: hypothetical protein MHM6MM_002849, partial [Cercozoa sp. M6MM]